MNEPIFEFEQNYLRTRFFSNVESFFDEGHANPRYFFYKEAKKYFTSKDIEFDLEIEDFDAERIEFFDTVELIILRGLAFGGGNCCNWMYFFRMIDGSKAKLYFSSSSIDIKDVITNKKHGLYAWESIERFMMFNSDKEKSEEAEKLFEIRAFLCEFCEIKEVFFPSLVKLRSDGKVSKNVVVFNCTEEDCENTFAYDFTGIQDGEQFMIMCPKCYMPYLETLDLSQEDA